MPCYRPNPALLPFDRSEGAYKPPLIQYPLSRDSSGARHYPSVNVMAGDKRLNGRSFRYISLPCGLCFGCRIDNARMWSLRMMHETRYHDDNYFVTLTYDPQNLPADGDLRYSDLQKFFKRARHEFQSAASPFKYFASGEYGDESLRPHYHFAGFGFKIPDLRFFKQTKSGPYFLSQRLREVWGFGHVVIAPLEWDTASYIARYVTKKMHGNNVRIKDSFDPLTGELDLYTIERAFQSKGLGLPFYLEHQNEIWDLDACQFKGKYLIKPPRYYFEKLKQSDPDKAAAVKKRRAAERPIQVLDHERDKQLLYEMEAVRLSMQTLKRSL